MKQNKLFSFFSYPTKLEKRLKYKFKNRALFETALSHKSYVAENNKGEDNEKLEYLGDAVLGLALGDLLMENNKSANEGQLSKMRSSLVSTQGLYQKALELGLGRDLKTGTAEKMNRNKSRILASCFEALIGAIYLDQGYDSARRVICFIFQNNFNQVWEDKDYKTILQDKIQKLRSGPLNYELTKEKGPSHRKTFFVRVLWKNQVLGAGKGFTKKSAEQQAAFYGLKKIDDLLDKENS